MYQSSRFAVTSVISCLLFAMCDVEAQDVAPLIKPDTIVVAKFDTRRVNWNALGELKKNLAKKAGDDLGQTIENVIDEMRTMQKDLGDVGGTHVYLSLGSSDIPSFGPVAAFGSPANKQAALKQHLTTAHELVGVERLSDQLLIHGAATSVARMLQIPAVGRQEFTATFKAVDRSAGKIVLALSDEQRRVFTEFAPRDYAKVLSESRWIAIGIDTQPQVRINVIIEMANGQAATTLKMILPDVMNRLAKEVEQPILKELATYLRPTVKGNRVTLAFDEDKQEVSSLLSALAPPIQEARAAASRMSAMNDLKQIGLAMHIHYDKHKAFAPSAITSKDGKRLLSWRVALLPYLEQKELYSQFHLNEPWDSDHNERLIAKIPPVFRSRDIKLPAGRTRIVMPMADGLPFANLRAITLPMITDGTSNTLMALHGPADKAVIWTKPEDLDVDLQKPSSSVFGEKSKGTTCVFFDGSARYLASDIEAEMLRRILVHDDGKPIE